MNPHGRHTGELHFALANASHASYASRRDALPNDDVKRLEAHQTGIP